MNRQVELSVLGKSEFRAIRRRLGLTQQQLADLLECSRPMISYYENGMFPIPKQTWLSMWLFKSNPEFVESGVFETVVRKSVA